MKYTKEILVPIVSNSFSILDVIKKLGMKFSGGLHSHLTIRIKSFGIDMSHFHGQGWNKGKSPINKRLWKSILVKRNSDYKEKTQILRRALLESGREYKCEECGLKDCWNNKPICIQIDHKDGDVTNNIPKNLRFLCPNCHSQTETFGTKNIAVVAQLAGGIRPRILPV